MIINKETPENRVAEVEFQINQIYALDVIVSSGQGKAKEAELKTTVYKRAIDSNYDLKTKNARGFFSQVLKNSPTFGFTLRAFEDEMVEMYHISLQEQVLLNAQHMDYSTNTQYSLKRKKRSLLSSNGQS